MFLFLQPLASWQAHINFVHPAEPTMLTFLSSTRARAVVVFPARLATGAWWSSWASLSGPGVVAIQRSAGFIIVAVDHSPWSLPYQHIGHAPSPCHTA